MKIHLLSTHPSADGQSDEVYEEYVEEMKKKLSATSMCFDACAPTSEEVYANAFSLTAAMEVWAF